VTNITQITSVKNQGSYMSATGFNDNFVFLIYGQYDTKYNILTINSNNTIYSEEKQLSTNRNTNNTCITLNSNDVVSLYYGSSLYSKTIYNNDYAYKYKDNFVGIAITSALKNEKLDVYIP
jgi:hypothetical protein